MNKITALILTYNEEKRIARVLECLQKFDDIIVYDKSSTDLTRKIARDYGAKVIKLSYYNDSPPDEVYAILHQALYSIQDNDWILSLVSSDIVHYELYDEMIKLIEQSKELFDVIEIPIYRYSMGVIGKNSYYGDLQSKPLLFNRSVFPKSAPTVHENPFGGRKSTKLVCENKQIAIYHLTHENLSLVMDRHWRYAVQYVADTIQNGKSREQVMKYAWHEMLRVIWTFFWKRMYKLGKTGLAQCMMLLMYNAMIYLNAYFSTEREKEIAMLYEDIRNQCIEKRV